MNQGIKIYYKSFLSITSSFQSKCPICIPLVLEPVFTWCVQRLQGMQSNWIKQKTKKQYMTDTLQHAYMF